MNSIEKDLKEIRNRISSNNELSNTEDYIGKREIISTIISDVTGFDFIDNYEQLETIIDKLCEEFGIVDDETETGYVIDENDEYFQNVVEMLYEQGFEDLDELMESPESQENLKQYMEDKFGITESDDNFETVFDDLVESWNEKLGRKLAEESTKSLDARQGIEDSDAYDIESFLDSKEEVTIEDIKEALEKFSGFSEFDYDPSRFNDLLYEWAERYEIEDQIEF